jgi:hypothetical protein
MIVKIENRTYSYQGENVCAVSASLNIYNDADEYVAGRDLCASADITADDFPAQITNQIIEQSVSYLTKLNDLDQMRRQKFPDSVDFNDAVDKIFDGIQAAITGQ